MLIAISRFLMRSCPAADTPDDPLALAAERLCWWIVALSWALLFPLAHAAGFSLGVADLLPLVGVNALFVLMRLAVHPRGWSRTSGLLSANAIAGLSAMSLTLASVALARTNLPLRDAELAAIDRAFGFDTLALVELMPRWPAVTLALNYAYASMHYQLLAVLCCLFGLGQLRRGFLFALAWVVALVLTLAAFPLAPALGWYLHFGITREMVPDVLVASAWLYLPILEGARSGASTVLNAASLDGVVTFPSFHAAAAFLLAWGFWSVPLLRWPAVILNAVMVVSTVAIGGHYAVDSVAGLAIAAASILVARRLAFRTARARAPGASEARSPGATPALAG